MEIANLLFFSEVSIGCGRQPDGASDSTTRHTVPPINVFDIGECFA